MPEADLDWRLLKKVSRSFYLTLRLLPGPVRPTIALAYLLARLTDTKADGAASEGERELLSREDEMLRLLQASPDREEITAVWTTIREGQAFDQERFRDQGESSPPPLSDEELERYTYLVAGCVGEFWTKVCAKRLPGFASRSAEELVPLGIRYGQALQLVNILRDRAADAELGRTYVPEARVGDILARAHAYLASAREYVRALRLRRLRVATALPLLLAEATLDLIAKNPAARRAKIPRRQVWLLLARAFVY